MMTSNDPAEFIDKPTKDVEYQCIVDNCHSHLEMFSEVLKVKVIGKLLCCKKNDGALVNILEGLGVTQRL
jgi:hypothetical protein